MNTKNTEKGPIEKMSEELYMTIITYNTVIIELGGLTGGPVLLQSIHRKSNTKRHSVIRTYRRTIWVATPVL